MVFAFWESQKYKTAKVVLGDVDPSQKEADVTPARVGRGCLKGIRMLHLRRRFYKCKFAGAILTMVSRTIADNECDRRSTCESISNCGCCIGEAETARF